MSKLHCAPAIFAAAFTTIILFAYRPILAHGFIGDRLFPGTPSVDDPLAADELDIPEVTLFDVPGSDGGPATYTSNSGFEFDKLVIPKLALGVSDDYITQKPVGQKEMTGWDNVEFSAKYQGWQNDAHEAVASVGLLADVGGTGAKSITDSFTTFIPTFYFGKGMGDIPDALWPLKPFAITGVLAQTFPTEASDPNVFQWGFSVEYNLPYLQQNVKAIGLPAPIKDMIPLVEFNMQTAENRGQSGQVTGTIDPGVLWENHYLQLAAEALIPVNRASGGHVGCIFTASIYIDDIFPKYFGHPIFGGKE